MQKSMCLSGMEYKEIEEVELAVKIPDALSALV